LIWLICSLVFKQRPRQIKVEAFIDYLKSKGNLSAEATESLRSISKSNKIQKGSTLVRQGQVVTHMFFVVSGCLRSYCVDKKGKEHTLQFAIKDWWISDYTAILNNEPAQLTVEALQDTELIEFLVSDIASLRAQFPELEAIQRKNLQRHLVALQKRILNQLQLTAAERYGLFLQSYPDIEQFTPNYHIASYLGITQESLSRIRAERTRK
jgi:CRP-like cAMP-binding protein